MQAMSELRIVPQSSGEKSIPANQVDAELKLARQRKVYIEIQMPKLRAEIKEFAERRKIVDAGPQSTNAEATAREKIYIHQHLLSLRKNLEALEEERKSVIEFLKKASGQESSRRT